MSIARNAEFAPPTPSFGPTFFALAGFVNEATAGPAAPMPVVSNRPASRLVAGVKTLIRRFRTGADDRPENEKLLPPTFQALAGFVRTATGGPFRA